MKIQTEDRHSGAGKAKMTIQWERPMCQHVYNNAPMSLLTRAQRIVRARQKEDPRVGASREGGATF